MSTHKKGQTLHSGERNMVRRIIQKCDEEFAKNRILVPLSQPTRRAADYTGVSTRTVYRIRQESSDTGEGPLRSPGKKRFRPSMKFEISNEDKEVIRNIIHDFYTEKKIVPTATKILAAIREKMDFPWKLTTLRDLLRCMGFNWRRCYGVGRVLTENSNIVARRGMYLKSIRSHRGEGRNIVYIDETWVDNNLCFGKCWQSEEEMRILENNSSSYRLITVNAGGKNGLIPGAQLICKSGTTTGDYHGQMNATNFEKWLKEKLIPNLEANSVVVMGNASYHTVQICKTPTKASKKSVIIEWLKTKNIPHIDTMRKFELMQLVNKYKPDEKTYKVDEVLKSHGFHVLRLPPYMCELNPIELAWSEMKKIMRNKNVVGTLTYAELETLTCDAIAAISLSLGEKYCKLAERNEEKYWEKDGLIESFFEDITYINETESDDSSSSEEDYN